MVLKFPNFTNRSMSSSGAPDTIVKGQQSSKILQHDNDLPLFSDDSAATRRACSLELISLTGAEVSEDSCASDMMSFLSMVGGCEAR